MTPEPISEMPAGFTANLRECCICAGSGSYWNARKTIECPHCQASMQCACPVLIAQRPTYEGG